MRTQINFTSWKKLVTFWHLFYIYYFNSYKMRRKVKELKETHTLGSNRLKIMLFEKMVQEKTAALNTHKKLYCVCDCF